MLSVYLCPIVNVDLDVCNFLFFIGLHEYMSLSETVSGK